MPRVQVHLPDDLYREVKERGLAASELLQEAGRVEVGQPTPEETARSEALTRRVLQQADQVAD